MCGEAAVGGGAKRNAEGGSDINPEIRVYRMAGSDLYERNDVEEGWGIGLEFVEQGGEFLPDDCMRRGARISPTLLCSFGLRFWTCALISKALVYYVVCLCRVGWRPCCISVLG